MWWWWSRGRTRILFQKSSSVAMLTGDHMTWLQCTIWFTTDHMLALPLVPDQPGSGSSPRRVTVMHTIQDCQAHMPFNTPPDWFTQIIRASDWLLARRPSCTDEPISPQILWLILGFMIWYSCEECGAWLVLTMLLILLLIPRARQHQPALATCSRSLA